MDGKSLSALIRARKKDNLRADLDDAGQEAVDPNAAWDEKQDHDVDEVMRSAGEKDHPVPTDREMGEDDSSQTEASLRKISARIKKYLDAMTIKG